MTHRVDIYVGLRLKQLRKLRAVSQADVARELTISFQQIQKYEIGSNRISASRLYELSVILNVPVSYFFEGLNDDGTAAHRDEQEQGIYDALSTIKDEKTRFLILAYIEALISESNVRH
ncbi:MAG: helix-turn-helix transcriptional regulator [Sulfitobacter sp.]